jgi:urease alpha subunit
MKLTRSLYAEMFGPTIGDQVRLAEHGAFPKSNAT